MDQELAYIIREVLVDNDGKATEEKLMEEINVLQHELDEIFPKLKKKGYITTMGSRPDRTVFLEEPFEDARLDFENRL